MPAAANLSNLKVTLGEAAPVPQPGVAELFSSLVGSAAAGEFDGEAGALSTDLQDAGEGLTAVPEDQVIDVSMLLPLIDQQRAVSPGPVHPLVTPTVEPPAGATVPAQAATATTIPIPILPGEAVPDPLATTRRAALDVASDAGADTASGSAEAGSPAPQQSEATKVEPRSAADPKPVAANRFQAEPDAAAPQGARPDAVVSLPSKQPAAPAREASRPAAVAAQAVAIPSAVGTGPLRFTPPARPIAKAEPAAALEAASDVVAVRPQTATSEVEPVQPIARPAAAPELPRTELGSPAQPSDELASASPLQHFAPSAPAVSPVPGQAHAPNLGAALAAQVLDLAKGGEWIEELARDIAKTASAEGAMRFRLAPETLGELRVEITQSERGAHIRLQVASEAAQQALSEAQSKLVQEARAQGVRIADTEISFASGNGQGQGREAHRQAQSDQPVRALRTSSPATNHGDADRPGRPRRADRYA